MIVGCQIRVAASAVMKPLRANCGLRRCHLFEDFRVLNFICFISSFRLPTFSVELSNLYKTACLTSY